MTGEESIQASGFVIIGICFQYLSSSFPWRMRGWEMIRSRLCKPWPSAWKITSSEGSSSSPIPGNSWKVLDILQYPAFPAYLLLMARGVHQNLLGIAWVLVLVLAVVMKLTYKLTYFYISSDLFGVLSNWVATAVIREQKEQSHLLKLS